MYLENKSLGMHGLHPRPKPYNATTIHGLYPRPKPYNHPVLLTAPYPHLPVLYVLMLAPLVLRLMLAPLVLRLMLP